VWHNLGETPAATGPLDTGGGGSGTYKTNVGDNSFVIEGHYGIDLFSGLMVEFSLGAVNRGSVTLQEGTDTDVGNLLIYPILVQLKFYPARSLKWRLQPFVLGGGGLHFGRRSVQFTNAGGYYYSNWEEDSGTNFNYVAGAGLDYSLGSSVGLDFVVKYMPIHFSKSLVTIEDYDAISFTLGVKYLYRP
jgi:outer membrane protein W